MKTPHKAMREDIQGIVASGYDHLDFARFVLLEIVSAGEARKWLKDIVAKVTTAERPKKDNPAKCLNLAIAWNGLLKLGLPADLIGNFPHEFVGGMHRPEAASILGDTAERGSHEAEWEYGGAAHPLHILALLYANSAETLESLYQDVCGTQVSKGVLKATSQDSVRERGDKTEPFGFRDGISQPNVKGLSGSHPAEEEAIETGEFVLGYGNELGQLTRIPGIDNWKDPAGYLAPHPLQPDKRRAFGLNGTYLVFRKLQQHVEEFREFVDANSKGLQNGLDPDQQRELFAAKMVGRWRSGAPLVLAPENPGSEPANDFLYMTTDPEGLSCPIGAHIRRANPRDSLPMSPQNSIRSSRRHRIIRRGRKYCEPANPPTPKNPQYDRGIYFIALNADLRRQYEFIQQSWLNNLTFNGLDNDQDPIAGGNSGDGQFTIQKEKLPNHIGGMQSFVTLKGGGYFFLPSIRALHFLAQWEG